MGLTSEGGPSWGDKVEAGGKTWMVVHTVARGNNNVLPDVPRTYVCLAVPWREWMMDFVDAGSQGFGVIEDVKMIKVVLEPWGIEPGEVKDG